MPLETTIHSGFITDLVAPREGTCGLSAEELEQLSYDTALELLHDFPAFIRSNPLVTRSALRKTATGFESFTSPGSGVKIHGTFNLYRSPDVLGVVHFIERNETKCNLFLGVYIKATLASSHRTLHENFKLAWNEALKHKLGAEEEMEFHVKQDKEGHD
ncbi:hypothetical protein DV735_g4539, partial [Chaetothyriales sp. CBS 134920]